MAPLYFLHLPKTGGTSIRNAAKRAFSEEKTLMLYGRDKHTTSPAANRIMFHSPELSHRLKFQALSDYIREHDIRFYSSHTSPAELPCFDPGRAFALFRSVPEQVLSSYLFKKSHGRTSESFEEFYENPANHNVQAQSFGRADLDAVGVIGILDAFDAFIASINTRFGMAFDVLHSNKRSLISRVTGPRLDDRTRERIAALNPLDVELYRRAEARWRREGGR